MLLNVILHFFALALYVLSISIEFMLSLVYKRFSSVKNSMQTIALFTIEFRKCFCSYFSYLALFLFRWFIYSNFSTLNFNKNINSLFCALRYSFCSDWSTDEPISFGTTDSDGEAMVRGTIFFWLDLC